MRFLLRKTALLLVLAGILVWVIGGAKMGFTQDVQIIEKEDFLGIVDRISRPKFIPGVEVPIIGAIAGGSFFLFSFLFKKPNNESV